MNKPEAAEAASVMSAWAHGQRIESKTKRNGPEQWLLVSEPQWDWRYMDYRIQAEPKFEAAAYARESRQGSFVLVLQKDDSNGQKGILSTHRGGDTRYRDIHWFTRGELEELQDAISRALKGRTG